MSTFTTLPGMTFDILNYSGSALPFPVNWNYVDTTFSASSGVLTQATQHTFFDPLQQGIFGPGDTSYGTIVWTLNAVLPQLEVNDSTTFDVVGDAAFYDGAGNLVALHEDAPLQLFFFQGSNGTYSIQQLGNWYFGPTGDDTVTLGDGNDRFFDPAGSLNIDLGAGDDYLDLFDGYGITAENASDTIRGGAGNDTINSYPSTGSAGDWIDGGDGDDFISANGQGAAVVGISTVIGGAGNDQISGAFLHVIEGAASGSDTYSFYGSSTLDYSTAGPLLVDFTDLAGPQITDTASGDVDSVVFAQSGEYKVIGSQSSDTYLSNTYFGAGVLAFNYDGQGGDDLFKLTFGGEIIDGGTGDDLVQFLHVASTETTVSTVGGVTSVTYTDFFGTPIVTTISSVSVLRFTDKDVVLGAVIPVTLTTLADIYAAPGNGNYAINGLGGNDSITGNSGADAILGGAGNDTMNGGAGHDSFRFTAVSSGTDAIDGGLGFDRIIAEVNGAVITLSALSGIEEITGRATGYARLAGTGAAENFDLSKTTLTNISTINMGAGNDTIIGSDASDIIVGGSGIDMLAGGKGHDRFEIGRGAGLDIIDGGEGYDQVVGTGNGAIVSFAGLSNIEAVSGNFTTRIVGTSAGERMDLSGLDLSGIALIDGGSGNDTIIGSNAGDRIMGNTGSDILTGGLGADAFVYTTTAQSRGATADTITDFVQGVDVIDLAAVDANRVLAGVQDFVFSGATALIGLSGQIWFDAATFAGETRVYGDTNGDARADMEIRLTGTVDLTATDFLF